MKTITIVGVGALGSHAGLLLRNEGQLRVIDFDRVEQKNVLAQFHGRPSVGKNKTESMRQTMQFPFGTKVHAVPHKLSADNTKELLGGSDLVLDCLDNGAARRIVQGFVRASAIPCLHGAVAADGGFGRVVWDPDFVIDDESGAGAATCEGGEHLPFIAVTSAYLARAAQRFLAVGEQIGFQIHPGGATRI